MNALLKWTHPRIERSLIIIVAIITFWSQNSKYTHLKYKNTFLWKYGLGPEPNITIKFSVWQIFSKSLRKSSLFPHIELRTFELSNGKHGIGLFVLLPKIGIFHVNAKSIPHSLDCWPTTTEILNVFKIVKATKIQSLLKPNHIFCVFSHLMT